MRAVSLCRHCQVEEVPFYSKFVANFYHERVVGFVQSLFCIYRSARGSPPGAINMVCNSFSVVKPTLHSWDNSHLVMVCISRVFVPGLAWSWTSHSQMLPMRREKKNPSVVGVEPPASSRTAALLKKPHPPHQAPILPGTSQRSPSSP